MAEQPIKPIRTNFTNPDYDADASARRETVYAPHEVARQRTPVNDPGNLQGPRVGLPPNHQLGSSGQGYPNSQNHPQGTYGGQGASLNHGDQYQPQNPNNNLNSTNPGDYDDAYPHQPSGTHDGDHNDTDGNHLEPYHTIDNDDDGLNSPTDVRQQEYPHEHHDAAAANELSTENGYAGQFSGPGSSDEPFAHQGYEHHHGSSKHHPHEPVDSHMQDPNDMGYEDGANANTGEGKKSWYSRFQDAKRGPGLTGLSDEEYEKQVGMSRNQMNDYMNNTPGVGGDQAAGKVAMGNASAFAGEAQQSGLGGWGHSAGSEAVVR